MVEEKEERYLVVPKGYLKAWVFTDKGEAGRFAAKIGLVTGREHSFVQIGGLERKVEKEEKVKEELSPEELAKKYNCSYYNSLEDVEIEPEVIKLVSREVAEKHCTIPIRREGLMLRVAIYNPKNIGFAIDDLKFVTGHNVEAVIAPKKDIEKAIEKYYPMPEEGGSGCKDCDIE